MYLKIHNNGEVVALCDEDLLGKVFSDGPRKLDLAKYADFYAGQKVSIKQAAEVLKTARNVNLVGREALQAAKEAGLEVSGAIFIGGVPHLQIYRI